MGRKNQLNPEDRIPGTDQTVIDFWRWGFSNIQTNSLRGIFAEFLVGAAIGALHESRVEWESFDLQYKDKKIEVKSAAYIQDWYSGHPSKISFGIGAKREYDYKTNKYSPDAKRNADIYVFCLLKETNPEIINTLDTSQWEFYVVPTHDLDHWYPQQKTISLSSLARIAEPVSYKGLQETIERIIKFI
ncbi:hypothetical protein [Mesobacillus foraminis]|uniref:Uncharacterized protein n=1 Tax=Mesobacillus foraminis TaxID=279826 RepID=A0A4R2B2E2_9BACI|nr:hypothetical protein [Mesobacillus foraminis]TCN20476.1 hypothetical protein EV146_11496 [Mesobacillus foraminis]